MHARTVHACRPHFVRTLIRLTALSPHQRTPVRTCFGIVQHCTCECTLMYCNTSCNCAKAVTLACLPVLFASLLMNYPTPRIFAVRPSQMNYLLIIADHNHYLVIWLSFECCLLTAACMPLLNCSNTLQARTEFNNSRMIMTEHE